MLPVAANVWDDASRTEPLPAGNSAGPTQSPEARAFQDALEEAILEHTTGNVRIVRSKEDIQSALNRRGFRVDKFGTRLLYDMGVLVGAMPDLLGQVSIEARGRMDNMLSGPRRKHDFKNGFGARPDMQVVPIPGLGAFNQYLRAPAKSLGLPVNFHSAFDTAMVNRDPVADGEMLAADIEKAGIPTVLFAHSRGALVARVAHTVLERNGCSELLELVVAVNGVITGIPRATAKAAEAAAVLFRLQHLRALMPESQVIQWCDRHFPQSELHKWVTVVSGGKEGDGVLSPEFSCVPGATNVIVNGHTSGHNACVLDLDGTPMRAINAAVKTAADFRRH